MRIVALKASTAAVLEEMDGIVAGAVDENGEPRELTAEEQTKFDELKAKAEGLQAQVDLEEQLIAAKAKAAKPVPSYTPTPPKTPAQPKAEEEAGLMVARIAQSIAAAGNNADQRAIAASAETLYGSEMGEVVANMEASTDTKGGFLIDEAYSSDFVDLLRPRVTVRAMGARPVPMPDGNLTSRKKTSGSQAAYVGERTPAPATAVTVDQFKMSAKRLRALVPISNGLIRRSSMAVQTIIRDDLVDGVAVTEDQQFLRGVGSATAPAGITSFIPNANKFAASNGSTIQLIENDLGTVELALKNANIPMISPGYIVSPRTLTFLEKLRDGNGNKVYPEIAQGRLGRYRIEDTTSVPDNLGTGTNESEIIFGDFAQFLIGDTERIAIAASDVAAYDDNGTIRAAFSNDETVVRLIAEHDTAARYDGAFAMLTGVTWTPGS